MDLSVSEIVNILRPFNGEVFSGKSTLALSTNYLQKLNHFTDSSEISCHSFHVSENNSSKTSRLIDTQFILSLFQKTVNLKIYPDVLNDLSLNISRFANIKTLEILKVDINLLLGLQKLRSQLQELTCCSSLQQFGDILMKCGGDNSQPYNWNELKKAKFLHNNVYEVDNSFDWTLSLHTLDISHNKLSALDFINQLPNLKYLNVSYNKLLRVPYFKGPICTRLQILVLNNNFIEDLTGLTSLLNIVQLDLNQNSLIDHNVLLSVSHLVSLQYFNAQNNPLSFHPNHRNLTCSYLNQNASSIRFLLDGIPLSKLEKRYVGSYHPVPQVHSINILQCEDTNTLTSSIQEKPKKIRNVEIEDKSEINVVAEVPKLTPSPSNQHLRLKKQVEQLREEFGESWLNRHSGSIVQDVLGFEKSLLSSTPINKNLNQSPKHQNDQSGFETANNTNLTDSQCSTKEDEFTTANESIVSNSSQIEKESVSDSSDGEDVFTSGEECIYLVRNKSDNNQVFVVVTEKFISERDVTNSKERARWHVNTIIKCDIKEDNTVKLEFNTLRRDRKLRLYELEPSEIETFYAAVKDKIDMKKISKEKKTYQCMKCSQIFKKIIENTLQTEASIECPTCDSNLVIEV